MSSETRQLVRFLEVRCLSIAQSNLYKQWTVKDAVWIWQINKVTDLAGVLWTNIVVVNDRFARKFWCNVRKRWTVISRTKTASQFTQQLRSLLKLSPSQQFTVLYRVAQKIGTIILYALTLPNINRFSKLFHYQNQEKICNNTISKDPAIPQVCCYTTWWNVKCLKSNHWKQDNLCNNPFKN